VADPPKPHIKADELPPDALKTRLAEAEAKAKRDLLASLGVASVEDAAKAVADAKALADAKKSDAEKLTQRELEIADAKKTLSEYQTAIDAVWAGEAAKLTPAQVEAINEVAGADANSAVKVRVLGSLRKTWATPAPAASPAPTPPPAPPASTTAAAPAPAPTGATSPTDHKAVFENLQKTNPIRAAAYLQQHEREIFPE
jgi:hypothetical protein